MLAWFEKLKADFILNFVKANRWKFLLEGLGNTLIITVVALLIGVVLGAPLGLGTVLVLVLQASIFQLVCRLCRFEPRSIVQENVFDTTKKLLGR